MFFLWLELSLAVDIPHSEVIYRTILSNLYININHNPCILVKQRVCSSESSQVCPPSLEATSYGHPCWQHWEAAACLEPGWNADHDNVVSEGVVVGLLFIKVETTHLKRLPRDPTFVNAQMLTPHISAGLKQAHLLPLLGSDSSCIMHQLCTSLHKRCIRTPCHGCSSKPAANVKETTGLLPSLAALHLGVEVLFTRVSPDYTPKVQIVIQLNGSNCHG